MRQRHIILPPLPLLHSIHHYCHRGDGNDDENDRAGYFPKDDTPPYLDSEYFLYSYSGRPWIRAWKRMTNICVVVIVIAV